MRRIWIGFTMLTLCVPVSARAQFLLGPPGGVAGPPFFPARVSMGGFVGPGFAGGFFRPAVIGPFWPAPITLIAPPPVIVRQPLIVRPIVVQPMVDTDDAPRIPDPDRFIVIRPDKPNGAAGKPRNPPDQADKPKIPPIVAEKPKPAPDEDAKPKPPIQRAAKPKSPVAPKQPKNVELGVDPAPLPLAPGRALNPRAEADRQVEMGRTAFSNGESGRALESFRRAIAAAPDASAAYFLLAQTQFAVGKYDEAVISISDGLKHRSDWPQSRFTSRELYRNNPANYDTHLKNLRDALAANLDDPRLLFLLGVELWFDGQQEIAKSLFEQTSRLPAAPRGIEAFLKK